MKISVIVSTYNRPDALQKVLNGLCVQTRLPDEVMVADDGSAPETAEMVSRFPSPFPLVHVWQEDQGFRAARIRNKAILKSTGTYLVLMDGDCIPNRHFIADHLALAEDTCFFQGKRVLVSQRLSPVFTHKTIRLSARYVLSGDIGNAHHLIRIPFFPALYSTRLSGVRTCNMGVFKRDMAAVNGFNQDFVGWGREDSELVVRLYKYGLRRKDHPFRAVCFHLWHLENDRTRLQDNDTLLRKAMETKGYECINGLVQK
jgi:glycosyltransferase involved in cell wall biosynthesis